MNNKKICTIISVLLLLISANVYAASFSDTEGHWAENIIEKYSSQGIITGYNGAFYPDKAITRGDMAVLMNRILNLDLPSENEFLDLDGAAYYADAVLKLHKAGIMLGDSGYVRPLESITREEAFVILRRAFKIAGNNVKEINFIDKDEISEWAKRDISVLCYNNLVHGSNDRLYPKTDITRAEVLQIMDNIISLNEAEIDGDIKDSEIETAGGIW